VATIEASHPQTCAMVWVVIRLRARERECLSLREPQGQRWRWGEG
jgi:hypothetical protein